MQAAVKTSARHELMARRSGVTEALSRVGEAADLRLLLDEIDATLARYDTGGYGLCELCDEPVGDDLLGANPMSRYCLCDLAPEELGALDRDLELAWKIQSGLLPRQDLRFGGWSTHYRYVPAGRVSGDYLDLVTGGGDGGLLFVLGDVSGKGVAASLMMAHLSALLRSSIDVGMPTGEIVERVDRMFTESTMDNQYATLVFGHARAGGEVEIWNAGHLPPLLVRDGGVELVEAIGFPVGLFGGSPYGAQRLTLAPGESLFLYTDGLTEVRGPDGDEYGIDRLSAALACGAGLLPPELAAMTLRDAAGFARQGPRHDDLSVLVVHRNEDRGEL